MKQRLGFTLVELLIVIVVIAILAALSIVSYNGIQDRANRTVVTNDLATVKKKLNIYKVTNGEYPSSDSGVASEVRAGLESTEITLGTGSYSTEANGNVLYLAENDGSKFALLARPAGSPTYYITDSTNIADYEQSTSSCSIFPGSQSAAAACLGFTNYTHFYIYVKNNGGFRIWSD